MWISICICMCINISYSGLGVRVFCSFSFLHDQLCAWNGYTEVLEVWIQATRKPRARNERAVSCSSSSLISMALGIVEFSLRSKSATYPAICWHRINSMRDPNHWSYSLTSSFMLISWSCSWSSLSPVFKEPTFYLFTVEYIWPARIRINHMTYTIYGLPKCSFHNVGN